LTGSATVSFKGRSLLHGAVNSSGGLLGCGRIPTFQRAKLPPALGFLNVGILPPPRRPRLESSPPRKPQIAYCREIKRVCGGG